ncbi:MAG TPA: T9SS C-terminal target domain-containing protein, partial [Flavobacteriales bacterium]|nr:T9SS C-terminal target domain-containing protein [Flavobacteriales bacterium]
MKGLRSVTPTRTFALSLFAFIGVSAFAWKEPATGDRAGNSNAIGRPKAAACAPATEVTLLQFNTVRAVIEGGGNVWQRRQQSLPGYEVPKAELPAAPWSNPCAIYAGGLWMGGLSSSGQLKVAAVTYRQSGNDFWPGPLNRTDASTDAAICLAYDKFWTTERAEAEAHIAWANCAGDPLCLTQLFGDAGYSIPADFISWPALGDPEAGQDLYLAPFADLNGNGEYEPFNGEYPDYGFNQTVLECKSRQSTDPVPLFGDHNIFWIFNDKGDAHTESNSLFPIGLEVRAQAFAFSSNNEINNMTFYNYTVINWASQALDSTYFGHYVDADLGCSNDDFAGCDVRRGLGYVYNWQDVDNGCLGSLGYGGPAPPPPAIGVDFFEGPYQDNDGVDNPGPVTDVDFYPCDLARQNHGIPYKGLGLGYGDSIPDNERFGMRAYIYYNRS